MGVFDTKDQNKNSKDHCHFFGKYGGATQIDCNLRYEIFHEILRSHIAG